MNKRRLLLMIILTIAITGCGGDGRVVRVATEAANRQAEQNKEMAQLNKQVTEGTKNLVTADAAARKEIVTVHREIQGERQQMNERLDQIETERKEIAAQRRTESILLPVVSGLGMTVVGILVICFCWSLLIGGRRKTEADEELTTLLVSELMAESSTRQLQRFPPEESLKQLPEE